MPRFYVCRTSTNGLHWCFPLTPGSMSACSWFVCHVEPAHIGGDQRVTVGTVFPSRRTGAEQGLYARSTGHVSGVPVSGRFL